MVDVNDVGALPRRRDVPRRDLLRAERREREGPRHRGALAARGARPAAGLHRDDLHLVPQVRRPFGEALDHPLHAAGARPIVLRQVENAHEMLPSSPRIATDVNGVASPWTKLRPGHTSRPVRGTCERSCCPAYADPAARGKLKALAGRGVTVVAAVPERWVPPGLMAPQKTVWGDDGGVKTVPIGLRDRRSGRRSRVEREHACAGYRRLSARDRPDRGGALDRGRGDGRPRRAEAAHPLYGARARERRGAAWTPRGLPPFAGSRDCRRPHRRERARGTDRDQKPRLAPHRVIPQLGVGLPLSSHRPTIGGLSIGFFGRLVPEKGLDLLFRAAVKLIGRWTVTVVGTGPAQEELEGLAERLGIAGRVTWLGALPHERVQEVWPRIDCVVLPSRTAPALGRGVAAGRAGRHGSRPSHRRERIGRLARGHRRRRHIVAEEDVASLTAALQLYHDQPAERARLGAEGRRRIMDDYTDSAIAEKTLAFWREATNATG